MAKYSHESASCRLVTSANGRPLGYVILNQGQWGAWSFQSSTRRSLRFLSDFLTADGAAAMVADDWGLLNEPR